MWRMSLVYLILLAATQALAADHRPNIVVIVVDDMRFDEFRRGGHPYVETPNIDRLADDGAIFTNAYHVTPLCSPNRASLLTGQYTSRHGILDNTSRSIASHRLALYPKTLKQSGYVTAHVGKWHMGNDPSPRPGYDYWVSFAGQGELVDPELYEDGRLHRVSGYITDIFTDRAVKFIRSNAGSGRPFFLYLAHKALHPQSIQRDDGSIVLDGERRYIPAPRHAGRYAEEEFERAPSFGTSRLDEGNTVLRQTLALKGSPQIQRDFANVIDNNISEDSIRRRAEMMLAIDEGLGSLLDTLRELNELDNTLIVFTSDNGFFFGEHGLSVERRLPYEEAAKAPLLMRFPPSIPAGLTIEGLVMSIDLAPTILEVAGVSPEPSIQGKSLVPLLTAQRSEVHEAILMEYYSHENPYHWTVDLDYRAVRKGQFKYIKWLRFDDEAELYDLERDPYELDNLIDEPSMAATARELEEVLDELVLNSMGLGAGLL